MTRSDSITELAAALAKAQGQLEGAKKDSTNPHFRSKYADLASVWDACRDALASCGLSVAQFPRLMSVGEHDWIVEVETTLLHASGQWMTDTLAIPLAKADAHGVGSAITYARRYALSAVVGVAPEDDDGNDAASAAIGRTAREDADMPNGAGSVIVGRVEDIRQTTTQTRNGPRPKFTITVAGKKYTTLQKDHADAAKAAREAGLSVELTYRPTQWGCDVMAIAERQDVPVEEPAL